MHNMKFIFITGLILCVSIIDSSGVKRKCPPKIQSRIVGGEEATPHEFPSILHAPRHCGAVLIHEEWALTAAYCANQYLQILIGGDHSHYKDEPTEQKIKPGKMFLHPHFRNPRPYAYNVALVKLEKPFQLNQYVAIAKLPPRDFIPTGEAVVAGWGPIQYMGGPVDILRKVTIPINPDETCAKLYGGDFVPESMICGGAFLKDMCQTDQGGPLFCNLTPGRKVLCGIASNGLCGSYQGGVHYPSAYTKTSILHDWIKEITGITV